MRVILTGAAGFIGSYVLERLAMRHDDEVAILVRPTSALWRIHSLLDRVKVYREDVGDREAVARALRDFHPDTVIHLAWTGVLNRTRNDFGQHRNVCIATQLIEACAAAGVRAWIGLGSQAEYGPCAHRIDESEPTRPTTGYGVAKLATCMLAAKLCETAEMRFAWLRLFSSYGPKDHPDWMIPYLALSLLRGERPSVTKGEQLWDYLFVDDAADALIRVACTPGARGIYNLGSGHAWRLRDVISRIRDLVDPGLAIGFGDVAYRPDQVMHLEANIDRLKAATGWTPQVSLEEGLKLTVDWYRKHGIQ